MFFCFALVGWSEVWAEYFSADFLQSRPAIFTLCFASVCINSIAWNKALILVKQSIHGITYLYLWYNCIIALASNKQCRNSILIHLSNFPQIFIKYLFVPGTILSAILPWSHMPYSSLDHSTNLRWNIENTEVKGKRKEMD